MKIFALILWVTGWPIAVSLCEYLDAKRRQIENKKAPVSDELATKYELAVWIAGALVIGFWG